MEFGQIDHISLKEKPNFPGPSNNGLSCSEVKPSILKYAYSTTLCLYTTPFTHLNAKKTFSYKLLDTTLIANDTILQKELDYLNSISPCQKISFRNHHPEHVQSSPPLP